MDQSLDLTKNPRGRRLLHLYKHSSIHQRPGASERPSLAWVQTYAQVKCAAIAHMVHFTWLFSWRFSGSQSKRGAFQGDSVAGRFKCRCAHDLKKG